ncbi:MAG: diguanylate cyclase [Pirellulales bacterium]|nr:diguanylate cyclase [Pirellulales bacterium]
MFGLVLFVSILHLILGYMLAVYLGYAPWKMHEAARSVVSFAPLPEQEIVSAEDLEKSAITDTPSPSIPTIDSAGSEELEEPEPSPVESLAASPSPVEPTPQEVPTSESVGLDLPFQVEAKESIPVNVPTITEEIVRWLAIVADFRRDAAIGANRLWTMETSSLNELDYISELASHCADILQKIDLEVPVMDSVGVSSQRTAQGIAARNQFKKNITNLTNRMTHVDPSDAESYRKSIQSCLLDARDAIYEFEESLSNLQLGIWQDAGGLAGMDPNLLIHRHTGLPSSLGIIQALRDSRRSDSPEEKNTVVAMLDLDYCRHWNNELGPSLCDDLLENVAKIAKQMMPGSCSVGCHSGQRFLILIPNKMPNAATKDIENVRETIAAARFLARGDDHQITITCAVVDTSPGELPETLLDRLLETLREAKRFGRNRTFLHEGTYPAPVVPPTLHVAKQVIHLN